MGIGLPVIPLCLNLKLRGWNESGWIIYVISIMLFSVYPVCSSTARTVFWEAACSVWRGWATNEEACHEIKEGILIWRNFMSRYLLWTQRSARVDRDSFMEKNLHPQPTDLWYFGSTSEMWGNNLLKCLKDTSMVLYIRTATADALSRSARRLLSGGRFRRRQAETDTPLQRKRGVH